MVPYQNGLLHRDEKPACITSSGRKEWYQYDKLHRDAGPAIEADYYQQWYQHGKLHRIEGPAVIYFKSNYEEYWLNGFEVFREDWELEHILYYLKEEE